MLKGEHVNLIQQQETAGVYLAEFKRKPSCVLLGVDNKFYDKGA